MRQLVIIGALFVAAASARAQQDTVKPRPSPDTTQIRMAAPKLRVYLDCDQCDFDYLRTEVTFVDYVRNRKRRVR